MRLIKANNYRRQPWKNGGGETIEIAVSPAGAGMDDFDWRVSMARVEADGPFSSFAGIDRTLTILDGQGMDLIIDGAPPKRVSELPIAFPGDVATSATLPDGPITDLNVMTRRGRFVHQVTPISFDGAIDLVVRSPSAVVYCHAGSATIEDEFAPPFSLDAGNSLLIEAQPNSLRLTCENPPKLYLIEIAPVRS